jgi:hypothetical protein
MLHSMGKIVRTTTLALIACSAAFCQLKLMVQVDGRMAGTWKLVSERVLAGPAIAPSLALGTIETIRKDAAGHAWVDATQPFGNPILSADGNTITGTVESNERAYYRVIRVWKRQ